MEIIAHRGASHDAPENTLAAAQLAWAEGADALELDVHLTADAQLAVLHDESTQRVAGVPLLVRAATMAELASLDVGRWKDPRYAGQRIPLLDEMLATVPAGKRVFIEIKGGPEAVAELTRCLGRSRLLSSQVAIISFDFATVAAARKTLPRTTSAWICACEAGTHQRSLDEIVGQCHDGGFDALDLQVDWPVDATVVKRVHRAGLKLYVWTVDDPVVARRLAEAGVDGIATNRPGWLRGQIGG